MKPLSPLETRFLSALNAFVESEAAEAQKAPLFKAYAALVGSLDESTAEERNRKLRFLFSSLVTQLDAAPDGEVSRILYIYTFREFLDTYAAEPVIHTAIQQAIDDSRLSLSIRTALATEYRMQF